VKRITAIKAGAGVSFVAAAITACGGGVLLFVGRRPEAPPGTMAILTGLAVATVILVAVGVSRLRDARQAAGGEALPQVSYRHTRRLFLVIGIGLGAALVARSLAVPPTFGEDGYYRGAAVAEAMSFSPRHLGKAACGDCHSEELELHDKDAHATVECEDCHGPGAAHVDDPGEVKLAKPKGKAFCLTCHQLLSARPGAFPQINWREHFRFVGVKDPNTECVACHSPHEPLFMDRDLRTARLHPLIQRCRDCHQGGMDEKTPRPEGHPAIFECSYCHGSIVKDAATRKHAKIQCTTCHIFTKVSDFAGRIIRDADPRFCLLCHRRTPFRDPNVRPLVDWPDHLTQVHATGKDAEKRCIDCHRDRIHMVPAAEEVGR
jgi:hypothetical protein